MLRLCLGELAAGAARLSLAFELRRELGDEAGASYSARNLSMASRPRWYTRWVLGHTVLFVGLVLALFAAGVVAAATPVLDVVVPWPEFIRVAPTELDPCTPELVLGVAELPPPGSSTGRPTISTLTISLTGDGQGQVTVDPGGKVCPTDCKLSFSPNTPVTLRAQAAGTSVFAVFTTSTFPCTLTLSGDKTVGAEFEPPATLFVKPAPA